MSVAGERWVVTGASSGVGRGLVARVAARGGLVTAALADEGAQATAPDGAASTVVFDVRNEAATQSAAAASSEPIDVLVACAAIFGLRRSSLDLDFDEALDIFSVNALGPLRTARAFLPRVLRGRNPRVVFVSSELGSSSTDGSSNLAYRASKAALNKFARGLAADLRPQGVTVIALEPGWVRTPMGGPNAPLSVDESVDGILATVDALTLAQSGQFLDYQRREVPW